MASEASCISAEQIIHYQFQDRKLLQRALTAAGVEFDESYGHDGNKKLASLGQHAGRMVIAEDRLQKSPTQGTSDPHVLFTEGI